DAGGAHRRPTVRVSSLDALRAAVADSSQQIIMTPGEYEVSDRQGFQFSGSNNDVDLSGAYIKIPMETASGRSLFRLTGDNITLRGGTLEDVDPDGLTEVVDFGAYNQRKKLGGMNEIVVSGSDHRIVGMKMTIRGSFPFGYGNMYGIGRGNVVGLKKHCGIQITGDRAVVDSCDIKMEAFGHVIYVQGGDRTTVRNTHIEGTVRPSNDCYNETNDGDFAKRFNYQLQWPEQVKGLPIARDHMINCTEDGIRAYKGAGDILVENCVVKKTRGGIKLYMAKSARVEHCQVLDCVVQGYSVPRGGVIANCSGNAAYGPLLYVHFDSHTDQQIELEVLPSPHELGDHPLAAINGRGHSITFTQADDANHATARPIIVGYPMRFDFLCVDYPEVPTGYKAHFAKYAPESYRASEISIDNGTSHPVVLGRLARDNAITSVGPVRDLGVDNRVFEHARAAPAN
ncbi:MAG: right-handed parallel beta-helix repeat-containing protein, partial [Planctomycetota bacterium]